MRKTVLAISRVFPFGTLEDSFFDAEIAALSKEFEFLFVPTAKSNALGDIRLSNYYEQTVPMRFTLPLSLVKVRWFFFAIKTLIKDTKSHNFATPQLFKSFAAVLSWIVLTPDRLLNSGPSIVYSFWGTDIGYFSSLIAKFHGVSLIARFHRYDLYELEGRIPFNHLLFADPTITCVVLDKSQLEYVRNRSHISNSTAIGLFLPSRPIVSLSEDSQSSINMLTVSSDARKKRLDRVQQVATCLSKNTNAMVTWTHIGELNRSLESFTSSHVLPNLTQIHLGVLDQQALNDHLQTTKYDFIIFMSDSEGIPYSMMQAMSFGIPAFSTDVGAISSIRIKGFDWVFPAETQEDTVAKLILSQRNKWSSINIRNEVQRVIRAQFGPAATVEQMSSLIKRLTP